MSFDLLGRRQISSGPRPRDKPAGSLMAPEGYRAYMRLLDGIVERRAPIFRAGTAYWSRDKAHRRFEACAVVERRQDRRHDPRSGQIRALEGEPPSGARN
jgi:hypothetical protein